MVRIIPFGQTFPIGRGVFWTLQKPEQIDSDREAAERDAVRK